MRDVTGSYENSQPVYDDPCNNNNQPARPEVRFHMESRIVENDSEENKLPPACDRFKENDDENSDPSPNECYNITTQILKIVAYILICAVVLISAMIAKGTLLFMTSQIRPGKTTPYCDTLHSNLQSYQAMLDLQEQAQWVWVIFFAFVTPEFFTLLRSVRLITFKSYELPTIEGFILVCLFETLHTIGVAILAFVVLPELNVVKGLMLSNCLCVVPGVFMMLSRIKGGQKKTNAFIVCLVLDGLAIVAQLSGLIVWPILEYQNLRNVVWAIPAGLFLTSMGWWENYIEENSTFDLIRRLNEVKKALNEIRTRYFVYSIVSVWKIIVFLCSMVALVHMTATQAGEDGFYIFKYFITFNSSRPIEIQPTNVSNHIYLNPNMDGSTSEVVKSASDAASFSTKADGYAAISVWGIQIAAAYVCYISSKFACRVQMQGFSFAIPITLAVPAAISSLIVSCGMKNADVCYMKNVIPRYLFWECPAQEFFTDFIIEDYAWIWFFWFISYVWITFHIWVPKCERLACTEKIFLNPMYNAFLVDQSVVLNRRRDDGEDWTEVNSYRLLNNQQNADDASDSDTEGQEPESEDKVTKIKACITMWHESHKEMLATLTSLMRLDLDQCKRRMTKHYIMEDYKDFYKLEAHIFMDDAIQHEKNKEPKLNEFALRLIAVMDEAAKKAYSCLGIVPRLDRPKKYKTPYGCRLVYKLLGGNKLYVHFKDIKLIRNRKRWSQVMYMYYLLGMKLGSLFTSDTRRDARVKNTYLLALDGDIDFQPEAVLLLVDLMKKNLNLGAACGRIHPVGSGLMAWYQRFEYAIGHWLQKATEHVIGCVLCSPGCFSLFRGQALCDVMKTYTRRAKEARHYVQYDQGEDRWLCTLMLQQGYRVEYAAASDAYTHCPESFKEFYNQRRRWVPSTMANIFDLLTSAKRTIRANDDISIVYIIYQIVLMASAIIGPGTIFIMVLGSMASSLGIDIWTSMWLSIIPVFTFMLVCFLCKPKIQIAVAAVLTCIYALLMMAVLVGIFLEIAEEGWFAPSSFFLLLTAGMMIVTALLHPMEWFCILFGVIYWVVIPSMYMLLIIYSAINMNDVTWGVRENPTNTMKEAEEEVTEVVVDQKAEKDNMGKKTLKTLGLSSGDEDDGEFCNVTCGNLWALSCCTHQKTEPKNEAVEMLAKLINQKLDDIVQQRTVDTSRAEMMFPQPGPSTAPDYLNTGINSESNNVEPKRLTENGRDPDAWREKPPWFTDGLKMLEKELKPQELDDWEHIIEAYLFPLTVAHENKKEIARDLKTLRNENVLAFFMLNAMFVVTIFLMQLHQDTIYVEYPDIGHVNITWNEGDNEVQIQQEMLHIEPIGFVFIIVFAGIMLIQFVAMLFHRFGTMSLILATTKITFCNDKQDDLDEEEITITFQTIMSARESAELENEESTNHDRRHSRAQGGFRRNTFHDITMHHMRRKNTTGDIEQVFRRRFTSANIQTHLNKLPKEVAQRVRRQSEIFRGSIQLSSISEENHGGADYETGSFQSDEISQQPENNAVQSAENAMMLHGHQETTRL